MIDTRELQGWIADHLIVDTENLERWDELAEPENIDVTLAVLTDLIENTTTDLSVRDDEEWRPKALRFLQLVRARHRMLKLTQKRQQAEVDVHAQVIRRSLRLCMQALGSEQPPEVIDEVFNRVSEALEYVGLVEMLDAWLDQEFDAQMVLVEPEPEPFVASAS